MNHLGHLLKKHIETNNIKKRDVANDADITFNYLSTLFNKSTMDCALWEKLCVAVGLNPASAFDVSVGGNKSYSDIQAHTIVGPATVMIGAERNALLDLIAEKDRMIAEKERTIQILLGNIPNAQTGQNRDSNDQ